MRIYIIGNDGITLCREAPATVNEGEIAVASKEELHAARLRSPRPTSVLGSPNACSRSSTMTIRRPMRAVVILDQSVLRPRSSQPRRCSARCPGKPV